LQGSLEAQEALVVRVGMDEAKTGLNGPVQRLRILLGPSEKVFQVKDVQEEFHIQTFVRGQGLFDSRSAGVKGAVDIGNIVAPSATAATDAVSVQKQVKEVAIQVDRELRPVVEPESHNELGANGIDSAHLCKLQLEAAHRFE